MAVPGIVISALRGGDGKTILSIGIIAAWQASQKIVAPFKKGPDYIDAGWLALAAGRACYNLDSFLIEPDKVQLSYHTHSLNSDVAVVEGNRGLYDGIAVESRTSTAEIAKLLDLPVVLCVDCTKTTRTMAAVVSGMIHFDPDVQIKGVVLNRVAGARHENILRKSIEYHSGVPVLGAIPKLTRSDFPERHMGLVPTPEHKWAKESITAAAGIVSRHTDLSALFQIAGEAVKPFFGGEKAALFPPPPEKKSRITEDTAPRIGVIRDSAFQFYYPSNIEALENAGAEIVFVSPLKQKSLPQVDALYIGGGFPETHAQELAGNLKFREDVKSLVEQGLPVYAECGGLMYLGERLIMADKSYQMTGILPIVFGLSKRPQGHGYTISTVDTANPYFDVGTEIRGHEFRYSTIVEWRGQDRDMVFSTTRGTGFYNKRDGICYKNVLASYTHLHALGTPAWAPALVRNALAYKKRADIVE